MSKYFDGEKLSGYEESPIPCVYGGNLEECYKKIAELEAKLTEKEKEQNQIAIEQLEKVKTAVKYFCELHSDEFYGVKSQVIGIRQDVFEFIDQQIKQLKGKVEE